MKERMEVVIEDRGKGEGGRSDEGSGVEKK